MLWSKLIEDEWMSNRKKTEELIYSFMSDLDKSGHNTEQYKRIFSEMSDKQFDDFMKDIRSGERSLMMLAPLTKTKHITVENNLKVAKKYGVPLFERLVFTNDPDRPDYKTDIEYLVLNLPVRRQSQNIVKKISVPENNKVIDSLTYQPTGESKGAKISYPEVQVMIGMGLDKSLNELIRYRGGDKGGFAAYNAMMFRHGSVNLNTISSYTTGVESTKTLKTLLLGMHLKLEN